MTEGDESKIVRTLQTPGAIVTYRAIVGLSIPVILALVGIVGGRIMDGIDRLQDSMLRVQISVAQSAGRIDGQESRINRVELRVDGLAKDQGSIDRRLTTMEAVHK